MLNQRDAPKNIDDNTVGSFGEEWQHFDQSQLSADELKSIYEAYFAVFPWDKLPANAEGFDMGCGSGRWAKLVAPRVKTLNCIEPSVSAIAVAKRNLVALKNVNFLNVGVDDLPLPKNSQDFGYSLGVLHHIPDTQKALNSCVELLKPNAPFLVYLYYAFDNRPTWFRSIWRGSEIFRWLVCRLPNSLKIFVTDIIAVVVYWPLAKLSRLCEMVGINSSNMPLHAYRDNSFYTMRTDSRDRFGTPLEQRFSRAEIEAMMLKAGLTDIKFHDGEPYWCAVGTRKT
jgi:SAM-dependent methyltransferase